MRNKIVNMKVLVLEEAITLRTHLSDTITISNT
jgi:hypothetical protein